jgi:hypothetical protein
MSLPTQRLNLALGKNLYPVQHSVHRHSQNFHWSLPLTALPSSVFSASCIAFPKKTFNGRCCHSELSQRLAKFCFPCRVHRHPINFATQRGQVLHLVPRLAPSQIVFTIPGPCQKLV